MKYQHPCIHQPPNFNVIRLDGQRRIYAPAHKCTHHRQSCSSPEWKHFKCSQRAWSRGGGKCSCPSHPRTGNCAHYIELILSTIIVFYIAFSINISHYVGSLALWRNRIGNCYIHIGSLHCFGNRLISNEKFFLTRSALEHIFRVHYFSFHHWGVPPLALFTTSVNFCTSSEWISLRVIIASSCPACPHKAMV